MGKVMLAARVVCKQHLTKHVFVVSEVDVFELRERRDACTKQNRVMEQLDRLKQGEGIKMLHRMKPRLLFPKLQERGWNFKVTEHTPNQIEVRIWQESM